MAYNPITFPKNSKRQIYREKDHLPQLLSSVEQSRHQCSFRQCLSAFVVIRDDWSASAYPSWMPMTTRWTCSAKRMKKKPITQPLDDYNSMKGELDQLITFAQYPIWQKICCHFLKFSLRKPGKQVHNSQLKKFFRLQIWKNIKRKYYRQHKFTFFFFELFSQMFFKIMLFSNSITTWAASI